MAQDLALGRSPCLVGVKGSGKSSLVRHLARLLGYDEVRVLTVHLYKDMGSRDLFLRRATDKEGNTVWKAQPLVTAARSGGMVVLDGIQRLTPGVLSILAPLLHDATLTLPNGQQLMRHDRFDAVMAHNTLSHKDMEQRGVIRVHPAFRLVALAVPPSLKANWLLAETASLFTFHELPAPAAAEEEAFLQALSPDTPPVVLKALCRLSQELAKVGEKSHGAGGVRGLQALSTRHLLQSHAPLMYVSSSSYDMHVSSSSQASPPSRPSPRTLPTGP
jgi:MoxR-like ATPase